MVLRLFLFAESRVVIAVYFAFYKDLYKAEIESTGFEQKKFIQFFLFFFNIIQTCERILQFPLNLFIYFGYDTFRWVALYNFHQDRETVRLFT